MEKGAPVADHNPQRYTNSKKKLGFLLNGKNTHPFFLGLTMGLVLKNQFFKLFSTLLSILFSTLST